MQGGAFNKAKVYTTSTASVKVPVALSFTCPKCRQHGTVNKTALLSAQATSTMQRVFYRRQRFADIEATGRGFSLASWMSG